MKKFGRDLLEVCKDIGYGAFFAFKVFVLFFWWVGVVAEEQSTRIGTYIKNKCKKPVQTFNDIEIIDLKEKALSGNGELEGKTLKK